MAVVRLTRAGRLVAPQYVAKEGGRRRERSACGGEVYTGGQGLVGLDENEVGCQVGRDRIAVSDEITFLTAVDPFGVPHRSGRGIVLFPQGLRRLQSKLPTDDNQ